MRLVARLLAASAVLAAAWTLTPANVTSATKWDPIDPKELAATAPSVEKDADAEVLLWDVRISDEPSMAGPQTVSSHYLRVKIYTDRGREAQSRVDVPGNDWNRVSDVEGRTVRRDGSIVELKKADVFERDLVKAGGVKVKTTSFVLPAVETGGIVEYRWRELHVGDAREHRFLLSRDIPVKMVKYHYEPRGIPGMVLRSQRFHVNPTLSLVNEKGIVTVSMANVPAWRPEPHGPPDWDARPWVLVYYADMSATTVPTEYWTEFSRQVAVAMGKTISPTPEIERAVASLSLGNASLDAKLAALVAFCREKIKRVDVDTVSAAESKAFKSNKTPTAALAAGQGNDVDIRALFLAMARAAGLDARLAVLPDRGDVTFDASRMLRGLMRVSVIAVRDGDQWRFLDPTAEYAPDGHLTWWQELQPALVTDEKSLITVTTPVSPPEWSLQSRTATLHLSADGMLEGDVVTELTGHLGLAQKEQEDHLSPGEREAALKELLGTRLPGVEVSDVHVDNVNDAAKPYASRYHVKVPAYAQRTGSRLFVQPAVLQKGIPAVFSAGERKYPAFFHHAWKEVDRLRIELPPGYELESPNAPMPVSLPPWGGCSLKLAVVRKGDSRSLDVTREMFFGGGQRLQFPVTGYPVIKQFFDDIAKIDAHTLTLRKPGGTGGRP